jgi:aspartyl-tRNA(Asn)/glutamyl-tRNA(Gln) amidotransferase subunit C
MAHSIDIKTVDEIAHLARLEFDEASKSEILNDMNRMLSFIEDIPETSISQKEALKNAARKDSDYFKAPKVIEQNR